MSATQVLICGAGPTGLVLALWLTRLGVRVRIIDKLAEPGTTSRALVVHARTLEFYRQLGIADGVVREGLEFGTANLWVRGRRATRVELGPIGRGLSPFPYMLIYPQDRHERFLIERLAEAGVTVERPVELVSFDQIEGSFVRARLRRADGTDEMVEADYLAGCDGARSTVRERLGVGFAGSTYAHVFYVADVEASGPAMNRELHLVLDEADFLVVFPLPGERHARLIGTARLNAAQELQHNAGDQPMTWDDVSPEVRQRVRIDVERVNWFSTYRVHHRVAERFRAERVFLLGDAAHVHSPVGAQGMNTGIGDAVNLAWKLAAALRERSRGVALLDRPSGAAVALLDTYEPERMAFARRLVATTDRAFTLVTSTGPLARAVRVGVVPRVLPPLARTNRFRRLMFRTVSQIAIHYRASPLSEGSAGRVHGGHRLPWVPAIDAGGSDDNFRPLAALAWQVHVYGTVRNGITDVCKRLGLPLHVFAWSDLAHRSGLKEGALYLVRPDGYVGLADPNADPATLERYADAHIASPKGSGMGVSRVSPMHP